MPNSHHSYVKPSDLVVIENEDEVILRRGIIHVNEITIDKHGSSSTFLSHLQTLATEGRLDLPSTVEVALTEDFDQLVQLDLLFLATTSGAEATFALYAAEECRRALETISAVEGLADPVRSLDSLMPEPLIQAVLGDRFQASDNRLDAIKAEMDGVDRVFFLDTLLGLNRLRAINRTLHVLDVPFTACYLDLHNVYLLGVHPNKTGCLECLERHVMTKFANTSDSYLSSTDPATVTALTREAVFGAALLLEDLSSARQYGASSLDGNVLHGHLPQFEFTYAPNFRTTMCSWCSSVTRAHFEERNVRAANLIKAGGSS